MKNKINITSTLVEKSIDVAKDFLDKLIMPTVEETGLLIKDRVTLWKFKNQVKILNKAKTHCEKNNVSLKTISLKLLCPLLDYAALEEEEELQDKWAILLSNMVDSEQNIENHVFPYLLSQVSNNEFMSIDSLHKVKTERCTRLLKELEEYRVNNSERVNSTKIELKKINEEISELRKAGRTKESWELQKKTWDLENIVRKLEAEETAIQLAIWEPELLPIANLEEYEISNLIRLGVVKNVYRPYAYIDSHSIRNSDDEYLELNDLQINIESEDDDYVLTELGEMFVNACNNKNEHA